MLDLEKKRTINTKQETYLKYPYGYELQARPSLTKSDKDEVHFQNAKNVVVFFFFAKRETHYQVNPPICIFGAALRSCVVYYLQAAEDGEQVVEGEHVTVNSHQTEQPGGTDEQQQQDCRSQSRATKRHTDI